MTANRFHMRALSFHGPDREPAVVSFESGLNVVYRASNTGKSFIVDTIDFMLGGNPPKQLRHNTLRYSPARNRGFFSFRSKVLHCADEGFQATMKIPKSSGDQNRWARGIITVAAPAARLMKM